MVSFSVHEQLKSVTTHLS